MTVKSGMVAKEYSVTPSMTAIFRKLKARIALPLMIQIDRNDTRPSAIGI